MDDVRQELIRASAPAARPRFGVAGLLTRAAVCGALAACAPPEANAGAGTVARADSIARVRQDSSNRAQPGYVIDSILPVAEQLNRFRAAVGGTAVARLEHASLSREALIRELFDALAASDTQRLGALTLTAREFADLVYPESPYTHPPMRQAPGLVWARITNESNTGFARLVRRAGGLGLRLVDHSCHDTPTQLGLNRIWTGCVVRISDAHGTVESHRLFGSIIERDDRFKIVSWAGEF